MSDLENRFSVLPDIGFYLEWDAQGLHTYYNNTHKQTYLADDITDAVAVEGPWDGGALILAGKSAVLDEIAMPYYEARLARIWLSRRLRPKERLMSSSRMPEAVAQAGKQLSDQGIAASITRIQVGGREFLNLWVPADQFDKAHQLVFGRREIHPGMRFVDREGRETYQVAEVSAGHICLKSESRVLYIDSLAFINLFGYWVD